jgi:hypothetical protein
MFNVHQAFQFTVRPVKSSCFVPLFDISVSCVLVGLLLPFPLLKQPVYYILAC